MQELPILDKIKIKYVPNLNLNEYPFNLHIIQNLTEIEFTTKVTFLVGENGTGKSTILEALAQKIGFGAEGGSKNIQFKTSMAETYTGTQKLAEMLVLSWRQKALNGYFFRAESFFNVANHLDYLEKENGGIYKSYGGISLHAQSHGESFLSFFKNRLGREGIYILDEPEAALSPQKQLSLLSILHEINKSPDTQFIIATHSPILLAYPNSTIYSCDTRKIKKIGYKDTQHYQITKEFLNHPEHYLHHLFKT